MRTSDRLQAVLLDAGAWTAAALRMLRSFMSSSPQSGGSVVRTMEHWAGVAISPSCDSGGSVTNTPGRMAP